MSTIKKVAAAGLTGVIGLSLGLVLGVTGANAVSSHTIEGKGISHSVVQKRHQHKPRMNSFVQNHKHQGSQQQGHLKSTDVKGNPKIQQQKLEQKKKTQLGQSKSSPVSPDAAPSKVPMTTK